MVNLSQLEESITKIKLLPCFANTSAITRGVHFCSVEPIKIGLSHNCFKVSLTTTKGTEA